jgi:hypothetical protein
MRTETLHPVTDYISELFNFLVRAEDFVGTPYFDSANPPRATIGYGFNIEVTDYLLLVLNELGIIDDTMTEAEITARRQAFTTEIKKTPDGDDDALAGNLDQVASTYGVSEFRLNFDTTQGYSPQGYSIFENIILGLEFGPVTIEGKQQRLDALLQDSLAHNSKEYVAVMSLYYNSEDLITSSTPGGSIADAVINDDRISAWYLIRYRRNGGGSRSQGIANRRYRESDRFGLWDNGGPTTTELEDFETFLKKMDPYSTNLSTLQLMRNYEAQYTSKTTEANNSRTIDEQINNEPAVRNYFISKYGQGQNINGNIIIGTELSNKIITTTGAFASSAIKEGYLKSTDESDLILGEKGADLIEGGNGNDVIYGGEGNDQIIGGADNDILEGGAGDDRYYFQSGDGSDKINDSEGKNQIIWEDNNGDLHVEKTFYKTAEAEWKSADGTTEVNQNSPYKMVFADGTTVELGDSISSFDINLKDVPANPVLNHEIVEDNWYDEAFLGGIIDTASKPIIGCIKPIKICNIF